MWLVQLRNWILFFKTNLNVNRLNLISRKIRVIGRKRLENILAWKKHKMEKMNDIWLRYWTTSNKGQWYLGGKNKLDESYKWPNFLTWKFPGWGTGRRNEDEDWQTQWAEDVDMNLTRVSRRENQRAALRTNKFLQRAPFEYCSAHACEEATWGQRKNNPKR